MSFFSNLSTLFGNQGKNSGATKAPAKQTAKPVVNNQKQKQVKPVAETAKKVVEPQKSAEQLLHEQKIAEEIKNQTVVREAMAQAKEITVDAQTKAREIIVEAKSEALSIRSKAETEAREISKQLEQQQRFIEQKLDKIDQRLESISQKEENLEKQRSEVVKLKTQVEQTKQDLLSKLEEVSGFTRDQAKQELFDDLEMKLSREMAQFIKQKEEEAEAEAEDKVKDILIDAMKHGATEHVPEYTISVVNLPSEETKGKIIGKSGRNINAFEKATGVDVDLDMSPTEVRLSCFDPVRREIARISLERLIKDGRIQPTRIEEVVDKVSKEIEKITMEAGKKLCHDVGVYNLPLDLMKMLGKFKYRFSYGQNLITHTLEETQIGIKIAHELKLDVNTVKLGCLLHDIGKVSDEVEGSHVELGIKIAKRYNMPQGVIDCIAQHHEDEPFTGPEQMAVYIADAISGARPGARYENYDEYVKRLKQLEDIAMQYPEVKQAYAIQAGREIRVLLEPEKSKDNDVKVLSLKIRDEIKEKVTYPGTVTVTVTRETRAAEVAK